MTIWVRPLGPVVRLSPVYFYLNTAILFTSSTKLLTLKWSCVMLRNFVEWSCNLHFKRICKFNIFRRVRKTAKSCHQLGHICLFFRPTLRLAVRTKQLEGFWRNLSLKYFFEHMSWKIQVYLKSDKINRHFTWRVMYIYDDISLNFP